VSAARISRILIAGAGALGSLFGAFLRRAGHAVTLWGRPRHLEAIGARGLRVEGVLGTAHVDGFSVVFDGEDLAGPFDLAILAAKSYAVEAAARPLARTLADGGAVLALQNGLGHLEVLASVVGTERVLAAPVLIGATIPEPGRVVATVYAKPVKIGALSAAGIEVARRFADLLARAGIPSEPTDRLLAFLWEKMLYNLPLNALGALLRVPYGALAERPESRQIMDDVIAEGFAVARADRVDLLWSDVESCRRHFYETLLPPTAAHRSSMLQDLERGRRTEIDAINGYVVRRAQALGVDATTNDVLTGLIHAREKANERRRL